MSIEAFALVALLAGTRSALAEDKTRWGAEVLWMEQQSGLELGVEDGSPTLFEFTVGDLHGNAVYHADEDAGDFCDPFGFCQGWLHQLELSGGVVLRF